MAEKEITIEIKHIEIIALLAILAVFFVFELQLTLSRPIVFGDEGHHARLSHGLLRKKNILSIFHLEDRQFQ